MKTKFPNGRPPLDLIEEAVHLLRHAPAGVHICYYLGAVPFVLALLHFWADMSRGAFAYDRVSTASLGVALLFIWMKCWHAVSAAKLRAYAAGEEPPRWTFGRAVRLVFLQAALQPTALIARPVAMIITLPYAWVRAFYENLVILGDGSHAGFGEPCRAARKRALLWTKQNHLILLCLLFFGFLVWLNIAVVLVLGPQLLKMFTGIETAFTESMYAMFNTTFLAVSIACTYLCVNPLTKAVYVLRCFHGESVHSGDDLRLEMRRAARVALAAAAVLLLFAPAAIGVEQTPAAPGSQHVEPESLDASISRVLKRDEFAWRMPRQAAPPKVGRSFLSRFLSDAGDAIKEMLRPVKKLMKKMMRAIDEWMRNRHQQDEPDRLSSDSFRGVVNALMWVLCALIVCVIGWLLYTGRRRFRRAPVVHAEAVPARPDLTSEDVVATQLPEDEWLKMAREMAEKGEFRLAVRALYLAALAHLGLRELITIARHKSNRDYQRELRRRMRAQPELLHVFGESVSIFEGAWYGEHEATAETVREFSTSVERLRTA